MGRLRDEPPVVLATVSFAFLHEGVRRGFLSKLGELAKNAPIYWKYGCWFFEGATRCEVLIESQLATDPSSARGTITLKSWTHGQQALKYILRQ